MLLWVFVFFSVFSLRYKFSISNWHKSSWFFFIFGRLIFIYFLFVLFFKAFYRIFISFGRFISYHSYLQTLARFSILLTASIGASLAVLQVFLTNEWGALFVIPLALFGALAVFAEFRLALVAYAALNVSSNIWSSQQGNVCAYCDMGDPGNGDVWLSAGNEEISFLINYS